jgi:hypothetical protein
LQFYKKSILWKKVMENTSSTLHFILNYLFCQGLVDRVLVFNFFALQLQGGAQMLHGAGAVRQVIQSTRSNDPAAHDFLCRFLESNSFWSLCPVFAQEDAFLCSVAVARRCRLRPDAEAARGVASLHQAMTRSNNSAVIRQIGLARARLLLANQPLIGSIDETLLEALAGLSPLPRPLVVKLFLAASVMCAERPNSAAARAWMPLLLDVNPQMDLRPCDALIDVIGTKVTVQSHPALFASFHAHQLSPELCVAVALATTPELRVPLLARVAELIAQGQAGAFAVVYLVNGPPVALLSLMNALLVALSRSEEKETRKEAEKGFVHIYTHLGVQSYGTALLVLLDNKQLSARQMECLWLAAWPVTHPQLACMLFFSVCFCFSLFYCSSRCSHESRFLCIFSERCCGGVSGPCRTVR